MTASSPDLTTTAGKLADLRGRLAETEAPVGTDAVEATHAAGDRTARERIVHLLDEGSFVETDALARHRSTEFGLDATRPVTDGVVTGFGTVGGRKVCVFSQDATVFEGGLGEVHGEKIIKIYDLATKTGVPIIGIHEGAGARVAEGVVTLAMYSKIFARATAASGLIPQVAVVVGENAGLHALAPAFADLVVMVDDRSSLHLAAPDVVTAVTGTPATAGSLGGAQVHATTSGTAHATAATDAEALTLTRELLAYLPVNNRAEAPRTDAEPMSGAVTENITDTDLELDSLIPDSAAGTYDIREVVTRVADDGEFLELQPGYAANIVTGFARVEGRSIGVVANQPTELAGCLDAVASEKAARFIRTCDAFNLPVVEFVDTPGFLPGEDQEHGGVVRRGAKLAYAYAEASVGKITVITRKAIGPAYVVMGSKDMGADLVYAWPTAEIAVTEAPAAVRAIHGEKAADPEKAAQLEAEYAESHINPYLAAERGLVDAVIPPSQTRGQLVEGLRLLDRKVVAAPAKKHGNIPL
ncbi:acyl-CoA carboxylase subunit beta [Corynebacterium halotolerans]|uniref:Acyl-CoA carboxylase subunit beta n=1 Tax=Corynebacterium halotolerans YIM 70093 = DSM 44683 TaxID=1121362 RepID=M1MVE5_9CORY|nr:acyl-CoA carboxylase subunit beta [Corynebacterium halotolerans]AGF71694.1 acyl-CoA carboxylase subunit beta [Corynebacterium halotolerans YIM 70093 = DSM 44683]